MSLYERFRRKFSNFAAQEIAGFIYERGHEYELLVKRTTLAYPPQDSGKYRYELVRIVSDKKLE